LLLVLLCLGVPAVTRANTTLTPNDSTSIDWSRVPEYRIVPGDKLILDYGRRPEDAVNELHEAWVRPDGRISVFPAGDVVAAGLTPMELQRNIIALLSADLKLPRVVVNVVEDSSAMMFRCSSI